MFVFYCDTLYIFHLLIIFCDVYFLAVRDRDYFLNFFIEFVKRKLIFNDSLNPKWRDHFSFPVVQAHVPFFWNVGKETKERFSKITNTSLYYF